MRHGKRPTLAQKKRIKALRLDPDNWLVVKDSQTEFVIVHKVSGNARTWDKRKERKG